MQNRIFFKSEKPKLGTLLPVFTKRSLNGTGIAFRSMLSSGHELRKLAGLLQINEEKRAALSMEDSF